MPKTTTMKATTILFFSLFCCHIILAQHTTTTPQTILLKDGSFLKGTVLEESTEGQLRIVLKSGHEIEVPYILVEKIRDNLDKEIMFSNGSSIKTKGFYQILQFGLLPGFSDETEDQLLWGLTGRYSAGYRFHPLLAVGAGMGLDYYDQFMIPAFVEARGYLLKKAVSPYYSLSGGYSFPFQFRQGWIEKTGGLMVNPSIGLRIATEKSVFHIDIGYQLQKVTLKSNNWQITTDRITYRRWGLRIGWEF